MNARCQCGAVTFKTPLPEPLALYICHCSECRKQTGSAFGTSAIFPHFRLPETEDLSCYAYVLFCPEGGKELFGWVTVEDGIGWRFLMLTGGFIEFRRPTASGQTLYCYFCRSCGTRLIHMTPSKNVLSVKGGCIEGLDWTKAIHIWTKSAMVPIPEGSEAHSEASSSPEFSQSQELLD
ncbi:uncharacterized protein Triagg1_10360 [Trichoderma aggressivum f. europaeum]|uniref:CENP-V/GFA domain-containing protein n=1 Tax=Trichoderma aggressivum f. europaeum TaxID=173218 RepID=A0AAE1LV36_9HYPO|nr:hypothetical protein Triagg1_10360 [Trichoderma aggressivum f. europaeum]